MKKTTLALAVAAICTGAHAQVILYNNLGGSIGTTGDVGIYDVDGGINDYSANSGGEVGQVITDLAGGSTLTSVESYYAAFQTASNASNVFIQVFNYSGGTVGSLVGQEAVGVASETDAAFTSSNLSGYNLWDISANVNIAGLVAGNQYLVAMQLQTPNVGFQAMDINGNPNTFLRDFSNFSYPGIFGNTDWEETSVVYGGDSGDSLMKIEATPEPVSLGALGLGVVAILRRRRRV